jgi:hypothetical protein
MAALVLRKPSYLKEGCDNARDRKERCTQVAALATHRRKRRKILIIST